MTVILTIIQIVSAFIAFLYIIRLLAKNDKDGRTLLTAAVISSFAGCIGYTVTLFCENTEAALAVNAFDVMGAAFSLYLIYVFSKKSFEFEVPRIADIAMLGADIIGIAAVLTDGRLHLFYGELGKNTENGSRVVSAAGCGAGAYILLVSMAVQSVLIVVSAVCGVKKRGIGYIRCALVVCSAAVFPAVTKIAGTAGLLDGFDMTSAVMVLCCVLISFTMQRGQLFDMVNSARNSVIDTMDDALLVTDIKMNIVDANPAAKRIFPQLFRSGEKRGEKARLVKELIEDDSSELEIGGKFYEKHITRLFNSDGSAKGYALLAPDITETKKYVNELIEMRQRADTANSAKSDFLANMSHEIRTPMNAITGFAELCLREKDYRYAGDIKTAAKNLIMIINDILDISKIESGKLELVPSVYNTEDMIGDVISIIRVQISEKNGVEFKTDVDRRLPKKMYGDEVRLKQILINLLGNAVKFTKSGTVGFSVRELSRSGDSISLIFKVYDTGIGIRREDIPKLFENFQQVDTKKNREIEGSGLGLPISKNLAEMMNGTITVESEYGKGSAFTVVLQQKISDQSHISANAADSGEREERSAVLYAPKAHVLVVDDNKVNLNVTSHILSIYGITPELADCGRQAIEKINSGYFDLVFMDHMMPELDGVDTTKIIRSRSDAYSRGLPIVALTANAVSGAKEMFLSSGFNDFISKPIQLPQLEKILVRWLPEQMISYTGAKKSAQGSASDDALRLLGIIDGEPEISERSEEECGSFIIPNVDVRLGLERCGGNLDAYLAVLKTFMETAAESIERIERFSRDRSYKDYSVEVHGLKSSAMAIGANDLSETARQLETAGREEDYKRIMSDTPALIAMYTDVAEHIKPLVMPEKDGSRENPPIDEAFMRSELEKALEAIDELDSDGALAILDGLLKFSFSNENIFSGIESARRYADNFAYEKAESAIKRVLGK